MDMELNGEELLQQVTALMDKIQSGDVPRLPQFSPQTQSALYSVGFHMYRNGKYEEAKDLFHFLTVVNSFERRHWMGRAAAHHMLKEYQSAIECYSVAAVQNPSDPYVHWHAADCFFSTGQIKIGLQTLDSAINAAKQDQAYESLLEPLELAHSAWSSSIKES